MFKVGFLKSSNGASLTSGPNNPGNAITVAIPGGDVSWTTPTNALVADNVYTTASTDNDFYFVNWLYTYNYGFSIPLTATITGIEVKVKMRDLTVQSALTQIYLWSGGVAPAGDSIGNNSTLTLLTSTNTVYTYGNSTDLWSGTLTPPLINDSTFGVILIFEVVPTSGAQPQVDNVNVKIYYTA